MDRRHAREDARLSADEVEALYERIVLMYAQQLIFFIMRCTKNMADAEDIVQDALLNAYHALDRYTLLQVRSLRIHAWLYKITWNVYLNHVQRTKPPPGVSLNTPEGELLLDLDADTHDEQPEIIFERFELRQELQQLVDALPESYRVVIDLYYFGDLSQQEIANVLQRPLNTVKTQMRRGLQMLRKELQAREEESIR
ncbi:RNA polymerase sigma factor [Dictyobacter aurantiacus]|uniref:RNA polymerase subunit sigma-24 n=1 Tax=Dictyobacter aurantiacus TaxID=1936993 RepID=A0A401ZK23_9CHLR|nr:sigma-70 family RNA polymerase sigma factor [Dictyobacter aurantiacus]GCE07215.1 RNA polymerase subunit sigma-24 [Dictyobacter aurantiacus]